MSRSLREQRARNIRSVLRSVEQLNDRDYSDYLRDFAPDFTFYADFLPRPLDRQQALQYMKEFVHIFPGVQLTVDQIFSSPDAEALAYRFTANADGTDGFMGLPPTSEPIEFTGSTFYNFKDGLRTASWNYWDNAHILLQMGALGGKTTEGHSAPAVDASTAAVTPVQEELPPSLRDSAFPPMEDLITGYGVETAEVHRAGSAVYLTSAAQTFNLLGSPTGHYEGMLQVVGALDPEELTKPPPKTEAVGKGQAPDLQKVPIIGNLRVTFRFDDADSVTINGTGTGRLTPVRGGAAFFMISAMGLIAQGTGRYAGASGIANLSGSTYLKQAVSFSPGTIFHFRTLFNLQLVRRRWLLPAAAVPRGDGTPAGRQTRSKPSVAPQEASATPPARSLSTYSSGRVRQLLERIANFTLSLAPDPQWPQVPALAAGKPVGTQIRQPALRLDIKTRSRERSLSVRNLEGRPTVRVQMALRLIPEGFVARPGAAAPKTALDLATSQRFVVDDCRLAFDDAGHSSLRCFGTGRTFPLAATADRVRIGAVIDILEGSGELAHHPGVLVLNGTMDRRGRISASILLRLMDPSGNLLTASDLPLRRIRGGGSTETLYMLFLGEPDPRDEVRLSVAPAGQMQGAGGRQRTRLINVGFALGEPHGIRSKTTRGPVVGGMQATAFFNPTVGQPPYPFQTQDGVFTFLDKDGSPLGAIHANMVEGRVFPVTLAGAPTPIYRVGALAPIIEGRGIFNGARGLLAVNSFISLQPTALTDIFILALDTDSSQALLG